MMAHLHSAFSSSQNGLLFSECAHAFFAHALSSSPSNLLLIECNLSCMACPKFCHIHKLALTFTIWICSLTPFYRICFNLFSSA